jgi:hypothetical protein
MRTPWKFLADLVSKKPAEDPSQDQDREAVEHALAQEQAPATPDLGQNDFEEAIGRVDVDIHSTNSNPPADSESLRNGASVIGRNVPAVPGHGLTELSRSENGGEHPEVAESLATDTEVPREEVSSALLGSGRPRKAKSVLKITQPNDLSASDNNALQSRASVRSAVDEMIELDDEILDLRLKLSQKLKVQNAQLKAMLHRFND